LDIHAGVPEFLVMTLLMGPVCILSRGQFEWPVGSGFCCHILRDRLV